MTKEHVDGPIRFDQPALPSRRYRPSLWRVPGLLVHLVWVTGKVAYWWARERLNAST